MRVVAGGIAIDHHMVIAAGDAELVARDAGKGLERRAGGPPAIRTMAIKRIFECIRDNVAHRAAKAFSGKNASLRIC
jgi:hypothetical protein